LTEKIEQGKFESPQLANLGIHMKHVIIAASIAAIVTPAKAQDLHQNAEDVVAVFETVFGVTEGKRRNHTKGFCFTGVLEPKDPSITEYSRSPLFQQTSAVTGRVSHKGGNNNAVDNKFGHYGLALKFTTSDGNFHQMRMNTEHFFPVSTPEAFTKLMQAKAIGGDAVAKFAATARSCKEM
jgi:catalase